jgi:hypothetical protein
MAKARKKVTTHAAKPAWDDRREAREAVNCIAHCFLINLQAARRRARHQISQSIPVWAQEAFIAAVAKMNSYEARSWDEVLARPLEKGKQL